VNCSETKDWLQCLRKVDAKDILKLEKSTNFPVVGTQFLPIPTQKAFDEHLLNYDIDLIAGVTRDEGSLLAQLSLKQIVIKTVDDFQKYVKQTDDIFHGLDKEKVSEFYLKGVNTSSPLAIYKAFNRFFGDLMTNCPTYLFAKHLAQNVRNKHNVYFYEWTYQSQFFAKLSGCDEATMGICHMADLPYVFGMPFQVPKQAHLFTELDEKFAADIMTLWSNFAKTGKPDTLWPQLLDNNVISVRDLNPRNMSRVLDNPFHTTCDDFWKNYYF